MSSEGGPALVGISSSPRKGGNSESLLDAVLSGSESAGARVRRICLRDLRISPCQNCGFCSKHGRCRIEDDMAAVNEALDASDAVVLASPIYFCSLCAQAKTMIDRCQPYWARRYLLKQESGRPGRVGGFVSCGGFEDDRFLACTERIVKTWFFIVGIKYRAACFVPDLDAVGDAARHQTALKDAFEYGRNLVSKEQGAG